MKSRPAGSSSSGGPALFSKPRLPPTGAEAGPLPPLGEGRLLGRCGELAVEVFVFGSTPSGSLRLLFPACVSGVWLCEHGSQSLDSVPAPL